jgi:hypothetical protein
MMHVREGPHYYLYVYEQRVDTLFEHIDAPTRKRFAMEFKVDLKVVSASFKEIASDPSPPTRYAKLQIVASYLRLNEEVGTIAQPKAWFEGILPMRSGALSPTAGFFAGVSDKTVVGLRGEISNFVTPPAAPRGGREQTTASLPYLAPARASAPEEFDSEDQPPAGRRGLRRRRRRIHREDAELMVVAKTAVRGFRPRQTVGFLAKRHYDLSIGGARRILLGSPLYVELID